MADNTARNQQIVAWLQELFPFSLSQVDHAMRCFNDALSAHEKAVRQGDMQSSELYLLAITAASRQMEEACRLFGATIVNFRVECLEAGYGK